MGGDHATTEDVVVKHVTRLRNTVYGNPRYRVALKDGRILETGTDSSIAYDMTGKEKGAYRATLESGKIINLERKEES